MAAVAKIRHRHRRRSRNGRRVTPEALATVVPFFVRTCARIGRSFVSIDVTTASVALPLLLLLLLVDVLVINAVFCCFTKMRTFVAPVAKIDDQQDDGTDNDDRRDGNEHSR